MKTRDSGWMPIVAGGIVMGLALGIRHVMGFYLLPVTLDRGWGRESFALAIAVQNLSWGLAQPLTGLLADRFGSGRVIAAGLLVYATGLLLMATATTPLAFTWGAGVVIGIGLAGTAFGIVYAALSRRLAAGRRSAALGAAGAIGGLAQFAMVPSVQALGGAWGWQASLFALAALMLAALPLARPLAGGAQTPGDAAHAMPLSTALREALSNRGFWLLNAGFLACGFQLAFIATHLPAYLLDRGFAATDAVTALALVALFNVFGTYGCGLLGGIEKLRRKHLLAGIYLLRTAAIALFVGLPASRPGLWLFAALMGLLWLGTLPLTNGLVSQLFGLRYLGTLFGFVFLGHQLGAFLGVWLGGALYAATRSYDAAWLAAMALGLGAAALHLPIDERPRGGRLAEARA